MTSPPRTSVSPSSRATTRPLFNPALGIGLMLLGIFLFSVNDALGKWLVGVYSVGMILSIRSVAALALLVPFALRDGGWAGLRSAPHPRLQLLRVVLGTIEIGFFYWAVSYLPLADVMTYYLAGPIYVAAMSAVFLHEKIGWKRWLAIVIGFGGVLIVLNPTSAALSWPALLSITGSLFFSVLMMVIRHLRGTSDSTLLVFSTSSTLVVGTALAPFSWVTPGPLDLALLLLLGVVALLASFCVNRSLKLAPASIVVPYQYTMILWAVLFGYLFFGDQPGLNVIIGAAIVVASGLAIFFLEQHQSRVKAGESVAEELGSNTPAQP